MKGFIEITQPDGDKTLLNVGGISRVTDITSRKCLDGNTLIEGRGDEACRDCEVFISSEDNDIEPKISLEQGNLYFYA